MREITDETFEEEVLKSPLPVLVDFWASWCPPCKMMAPVMERLADEYEGKVKIVGLNVDRNARSASAYGVSGVPTIIFFRDGKPGGERLVGAQTVGKLRGVIGTLG